MNQLIIKDMAKDYLHPERVAERKFMAEIARDIQKIEWMLVAADDQQENDKVYSLEYDFSVLSRLLTLSPMQACKTLLQVISSQNLAPLFTDYPESVMGQLLEYNDCHFDFVAKEVNNG